MGGGEVIRVRRVALRTARGNGPHSETRRDRKGDLGVNAYEQLLAIRDRLEHIGGNEASIELVDKFIARAESERNSQTSVPQVMMLRHLLRQREALDNDAIYNDLQELMDDFDKRRVAEDDVRPAYEDNERHPRPRSYYKALKEKEQQHKP